MKLEHKVKEGVFIRSKLYAFINSEDKTVIKSAGIKPTLLTYEDFEKMKEGQDVRVRMPKFISLYGTKRAVGYRYIETTLRGVSRG